MTNELIKYSISDRVEAFSTRRDSILPYEVIQPHQTHSVNVAVIDRPGMTREELEGVDALVTNLKGVAIGVRTADCIPVLLYDPVHKAIGAVHSGWRGTVNKICNKAIATMSQHYGTRASDLLAVIGPGIGADAFQVGTEVVEFFKASGFLMEQVCSFRGPAVPGDLSGGFHIDLPESVRYTLTEYGVPESNIQMAGICTYSDPEFFSARREGKETGRIINSIKILNEK